MKRLLTFAAAVILLLACGRQQEMRRAMYVEDAMACIDAQDYEEAERIAYAAAVTATDSIEMGEALSLLSFVYILEQKDEQAQMLMDVMPADGMMRYIRLQEAQSLRERSRQQWLMAMLVVGLAAVTAALLVWQRRRKRRMDEAFRQKVEELEALTARLQSRESKAVTPLTVDVAKQIGSTKLGVDVLYAILHDANISQMGRREQLAVVQTVRTMDPPLAAILEQVPLTPKETFFCIMEHYGKTDAQKARCFCCSEQAVRSTKSRLGKKIEIGTLRT